MQVDGFFIIVVFIFIFLAWVATGGPTRPIAHQGPYITPVTTVGQESQGYHTTAPANSTNPNAYPSQISGSTVATTTDYYTRTASTTGN